MTQRTLPITVCVPEALVTVEAARWALGVDEDSVLSLIETGGLRWAWDIAVRRGQIREVRIWSRCITARVAGAEQPSAAIASVLDALGVTALGRLRAAQVRQILTCSQQHVQRLVASGVLRADLARGTRWVDPSSLRAFLTARQISK